MIMRLQKKGCPSLKDNLFLYNYRQLPDFNALLRSEV
jgi:hypothetical protein